MIANVKKFCLANRKYCKDLTLNKTIFLDCLFQFVTSSHLKFETLKYAGFITINEDLCQNRFRVASGSPRSPIGFEEAFKEGNFPNFFLFKFSKF